MSPARRRGFRLAAEVVASLPTPLLVVSRRLVLLAMSAAAEELLSVSAARAVGRSVRELPRAGGAMAEILARGIAERATVRGEVDLGPPHGKVAAVAAPVLGPASVRAAVLQLRGQGPRVHLQALAAGLAHEIKNPLAGLAGAADLLSQELPEDSPLRGYTDLISREAGRVDRLVQALLDLTRPLAVHTAPENLHRICDDVLLLAGAHLPEGVRLERRYDPSLPAVEVDRERMTQVLLNLLKNAIEASPPGGTVVLETGVAPGMKVRVGERVRPLLRVSVLDEGAGVPDEVEPFTPFQSTKPKGTGLGLVVSRQIVEAHGGRLDLRDRRDGRGAEAEVLLPL